MKELIFDSEEFDNVIRKILNECDMTHIDAAKTMLFGFAILLSCVKKQITYSEFYKILNDDNLVEGYRTAFQLHKKVQKEFLNYVSELEEN